MIRQVMNFVSDFVFNVKLWETYLKFSSSCRTWTATWVPLVTLSLLQKKHTFILINGLCCTKRSLMSWVAWPRPSFFWYDTKFLLFFFYLFIHFFFWKVGVIPKEGRVRPCMTPSFGMTTTQDIWDLFVWCSPFRRWTIDFKVLKLVSKKLFWWVEGGGW